MAHRILRPEMEEQRVTAVFADPLAQRSGPLARLMHPTDEQMSETALLEELRNLLNDPPTELVSTHAAVPVEERRVGRDDVGRVRNDQPELLALHRIEAVSGPKPDVVDAVELEIERRKAQRAGIDVARDHDFAVLCRQQRLDAAAGAEIERLPDTAPHGELREGHRRRLDAGDEVGRRLRPALVLEIRRNVVVAVRDKADERREQVPVEACKTEA